MAYKLASGTVLTNMTQGVDGHLQPAIFSKGFENKSVKNDGNQSFNAVQQYAIIKSDLENGDAIDDKIFESDSGKKDLNISELDEECNNNAVGYLSLNVDQSEIDILNNSTSDEEDVENEKTEASFVSDTKEVESDLHCPLCYGYFVCPKFLACLHTFCQSCLVRRVKSSHKFVRCPVCRMNCDIPKGGVTQLKDNIVIASLVSAIKEEQQNADCMVCKLHDETKASTGQCIDCGDMMCEDCCKKHTYSRLTAKHKVVSLEEIKSEKYAAVLKKSKIVNCTHHSEKKADYFCNNCSLPVCDECSRSGHRSHECEAFDDAVFQKKEALEDKLELLKQEMYVKLEDDSEESAALISEFEKKEFKNLKDAKDKLISVIEQKYNHCVAQLQNEFDIKRRKYCQHKKAFVQLQQKQVDIVIEKTSFLLRKGSAVECAMLETFLNSVIEQRRISMSNVRPKLTRKNYFPSVYINKEHLNVLEGLDLFTTTYAYRDQKAKESVAKFAKADLHVENGEVRMKIGQNVQTPVSDVLVGTKPTTMFSLTLPDTRVSRGRGDALKSLLPSVSDNRPSLLGEYPGQNLICTGQNKFSHSTDKFSGRAENCGHYYEGKIKDSLTRGRTSVSLNFFSSVDIKVAPDKRVPNISDITFMSYMNFAVADARNYRLKIFNLNGQFVKYIDDPGPVSVTFCAKHLIWTSRYSAVRFYDVNEQRIVKVQSVPQTASHPLTSFNNLRYLIGNIQHSKVEVCSVDGSRVHVIQPQNRNGQALQDISHIAARSSDQLVCVDQQMKKLVVTDLDGNFTGEYSHEEFEPGGVCVTENDYIFLTDKRRNKLILLNADGKFIHDWNTRINAPSSVACNGMGRVIVAGNGKSVSVYEYAFD